ncbi:hypothetical protein F6R98_15250 [Candidatus Methylospira mobilis]|uniref:Uncharacterized protein n=1 Tax=Candidatus Methylospira mobilis TaxID=1808979 RepID=A0A5Q0BP07_9GAMM|nr:hypothetical protein [Candidatus Methylospira mobilis]QFY43817.1 hypothetical protein F6R98_15250 [Candidatus Methylospira mobilis]WNV04808.1 hypothetical protein RP726_20840 [Candidatus Methylospira mobilis]
MKRPESPQSTLPIQGITLLIMIAFTLIGVAVTDYSPQDAFIYWMVMFLVFGLTSIVAGWHSAHLQVLLGRQSAVKNLLREQFMHWSGALVIVSALFSFVMAGHMTQEATGLMVMLLLGLTTFLDGIRLGWRFCLTGIYLAVAVAAANLLENSLPALLALAITIIGAIIYLQRRKSEPPTDMSAPRS